MCAIERQMQESGCDTHFEFPNVIDSFLIYRDKYIALSLTKFFVNSL